MTSLRMIEDDKKCKTSSSNDYFKYNVGETLKNMRLSKNLTQKFVARANGLSPAMISLIESN
ncbi:MAG TPA: helix-turn-helix transcriptional regulator, partial [Geobacteraceae bacterium]|nr:helix-turn-helix transcriptional regulator [Geobacteraceae bacterium]